MNDNISRSGSILQNICDFYFRIAGLGGMKHGMEDGYSYVWNKTGPWPAFVFGVSLQNSPEGKIAWIKNLMEKELVPPFWIFEEPAEEESFYRKADEMGLRIVNRWAGMSLEASAVITVGIPEGLRVKKITGAEELSVWIKLVNEELLSGDKFRMDFGLKMLEDPMFDFYIAYLGEKAVSTSLAFSSGENAGLYMIASDSGFRGRGFGTAVTQHAIQECIDKGTGHLVLHATRLGEPVYRKLGFVEYCRIGILWMMD